VGEGEADLDSSFSDCLGGGEARAGFSDAWVGGWCELALPVERDEFRLLGLALGDLNEVELLEPEPRGWGYPGRSCGGYPAFPGFQPGGWGG